MQTIASAAPTSGLVFRREVRIEWGDCDPAGIVDPQRPGAIRAQAIPQEIIDRFDQAG